MVRLDGITVRRKGRAILGPLTLELEGMGVTQIVGRNGSGKSTLLRLLHGLERPRGGAMTWGIEPDRSAESFVFQTPTLLRRTVRENLELPLRLRGQAVDAVDEMAERFGLSDMLKRPAQMLSGGEAQRVSIARALLTNPTRLYLDEPTANLDRASTEVVEDHIVAFAARDETVILTTHSARQLERIGGNVVFMDAGQGVGPMPVPQFLKSPPTQAATDWLTGD
ncbi:MAG: ABC transporter ATP-binding protein [Planktomarina sp.]